MTRLADPRIRLGAGTAALLVTAVAVHRDHVGPAEDAVFRAVNGLPDSLYLPAWAVMQLGTLGAAPAAAGVAWLAADGELAARLLASGTATWALSKLVKQIVRRPGRPPCCPVPGAGGVTPPGSGTCPGTPAWPSRWARPPCPAWARPAAHSS